MKKLLWTVIPILLLSLLIGCDKQPQTPPTTEPAVTQPAPTVTTAPTTEPGPDPAEVSLNSLRQSLVGTPQKFAVAYLGTLEQETQDLTAFIRQNVPQLCEDLPFLTAFGPEDTAGTKGELYCIVPAEGSTVVLSRILRDEYGWITGSEDFLTRDTDAPFLLLCNAEENPDTELRFACADGSTFVWQARRNHFGFVALPYDEEEYLPLIRDFSGYADTLEAEYRSLVGNGWFIPSEQDLLGTSWYFDAWVDIENLYIEQEILFEEDTVFIRWYDDLYEDYSIFTAIPWSLEVSEDAATLTLEFDDFGWERTYNILLHDSGEGFFIMENVAGGNYIREDEALSRYMIWSDLAEAPDPMEMVGTWQRAYFEVEGYREDSAPGDATLVIEGVSEDALFISYTDKAFPQNNYQDKGTLIELREMYDGCGNGLWVADVLYSAEDGTSFTVTLLSDGLLLLQNYWTMDGAPMVSYEWYERIG